MADSAAPYSPAVGYNVESAGLNLPSAEEDAVSFDDTFGLSPMTEFEPEQETAQETTFAAGDLPPLPAATEVVILKHSNGGSELNEEPRGNVEISQEIEIAPSTLR